MIAKVTKVYGMCLRWTCKGTHRLAAKLNQQGHQVGQRTVSDLLSSIHYGLQSTRKTREGGKHEDRDAQSMHIAKTTRRDGRSGQGQ